MAWYLPRRQHPLGFKFGTFDAEEGLDIAHVGVCGKKPLRQCQMRWHVCAVHDEDEIWPRRHAVALLHGWVCRDTLFKCVQVLWALVVQGDFNNGAQSLA